jgi:N-acetylmuramoyl-L-alanine amidase
MGGAPEQPTTPISAPCSRRFRAVHTSGRRDPRRVRWIVLHDEEAKTAVAAAAWFANPESQGSAHLCVDDAICFRTLDDADIAWGAPGANEDGFHIEQAGFARWSAVIWRQHRQTLQRAAYKTAMHCHAFGVPPRFVTAPALRNGNPGITTHAECSKAFGGDHTDPGRFWPRRQFMFLVRRYYDELAT